MHGILQEEHKKAREAIMARAQEKANQMNDGTLTVEHMVLALADNPRWVAACVGKCQVVGRLRGPQGALPPPFRPEVGFGDAARA